MTDPGDIYRQEKMRELGKDPDDVDPMDLGLADGNPDATGGGGGGDEGSGDGGGDGSSAKSREESSGKKRGSLDERVKLYLQKVKSKSDSSTVSGSNTAINLLSNPNSNESQKNVSTTIRKIRVRMLEAPGLNGGTVSISSAIEQAGPNGGLWGDAFLTKKDYGRKAIVYLSFDPTTGQCGTCNNDRGTGGCGGGGGGLVGSR
jgi:hypothetical protein